MEIKRKAAIEPVHRFQRDWLFTPGWIVLGGRFSNSSKRFRGLESLIGLSPLEAGIDLFPLADQEKGEKAERDIFSRQTLKSVRGKKGFDLVAGVVMILRLFQVEYFSQQNIEMTLCWQGSIEEPVIF